MPNIAGFAGTKDLVASLDVRLKAHGEALTSVATEEEELSRAEPQHRIVAHRLPAQRHGRSAAG